MLSVKLTEEQARKFYPSVPDEFKAVMEEQFGKPFFSQKITDRVKNFEDACKALNVNPTFHHESNDETAYRKLKLIVAALNEGWTPDWDDSSERKYYPWFYMDSSNGFSLYVVGYLCSTSAVSSRLCFKSEELAQYAAKQFLSIYKDFYTL